jgi:hypothetical protein
METLLSKNTNNSNILENRTYRQKSQNIKLPTIYSPNKFDFKQNQKIIILLNKSQKKKQTSSFITDLKIEIKHKKIPLSSDITQKQINFRSRNLNKYRFNIFDNFVTKNELKQLSLHSLYKKKENNIFDKNTFAIYNTFRNLTFEGEKKLRCERKKEIEKFANNYKDYFRKKQKKKKLNYEDIYLKRYNDNLEERSKCYLNYLKDQNFQKIDSTNEKIEKVEKEINDLYNDIKIQTGNEFDKIYKSQEI